MQEAKDRYYIYPESRRQYRKRKNQEKRIYIKKIYQENPKPQKEHEKKETSIKF